MNSSDLSLLFPQWQGAGHTNELYRGAKRLQQCLPDIPFQEVEVAAEGSLELENDILGYASVLSQLRHAADIVKGTNPDRVLTIGGGCGVVLAPVTYLNSRYDGDLGLIWFDAHGDLNTPGSSPSKLFHGMPVRMLLGEGNAEVLRNCFSTLQPNQVTLVGIRKLDQPEEAYVRQHSIATFGVGEVTDHQSLVIESIRSRSVGNIHVHIDLDVLEPDVFPHVKCPVLGGFTVEALAHAVQQLRQSFNLVGFSVAEFAPSDNRGIDDVVKIIQQGIKDWRSHSP